MSIVLGRVKLKSTDFAEWRERLHAAPSLHRTYWPILEYIVAEWLRDGVHQQRGAIAFNRVEWSGLLCMPRRTISRHLKVLDDCGAISKEIAYEPEWETGIPRSHIEVTPTADLLERPEMLRSPEYGGLRLGVGQKRGAA